MVFLSTIERISVVSDNRHSGILDPSPDRQVEHSQRGWRDIVRHNARTRWRNNRCLHGKQPFHRRKVTGIPRPSGIHLPNVHGRVRTR